MTEPLAQVLILLAAAVFAVTVVRRMGLPATLAYLAVGLALGPHPFGFVSESQTTSLLGELGVAFLLFTLGLEFSFPRMIAMRREVFGLGAAQVAATTAVFGLIAWFLGLHWLTAIVVGGAIAMSSTAILLQTLTETAELNRTHGRLAFSMLLFQDLAFVPLLALASGLGSTPIGPTWTGRYFLGADTQGRDVMARILYAVESIAYTCATRVSTISPGILRLMRAKGVPERKLLLFPNGVRLEEVSTAKGAFMGRPSKKWGNIPSTIARKRSRIAVHRVFVL